MNSRCVLYIVENGVTKTHVIPTDESLEISRDRLKEGWGEIVGCVSLQEILTDFSAEFLARKRAVRQN